jgi:tetratricopeptide (TPR) repeat protein
LETALFIAKQLDTTDIIVKCYVGLGDAHAAKGKLKDALMCYHAGFARLENNQQSKLYLLCQIRIAQAQIACGDVKEALTVLISARLLAQQLNDQEALVECRSILASIEMYDIFE